MKYLESIVILAVGMMLTATSAKAQEGPFWQTHPHSLEITAGYPYTMDNNSTWGGDDIDDYNQGLRKKLENPVFVSLVYSYRIVKRWEFSIAFNYYSSVRSTYRYPGAEGGGYNWNATPQKTDSTPECLTAFGSSVRFYWVERPAWRMYSSLGLRYVFDDNIPLAAVMPDVNLLGVRFGSRHLYGIVDLVTFGPVLFVMPQVGLGLRF